MTTAMNTLTQHFSRSRARKNHAKKLPFQRQNHHRNAVPDDAASDDDCAAADSVLTAATTTITTTTTTTTNMTIQVPQHYMQDSIGYPSSLHSIHVESILTDEEAAHCHQLAVSFGGTGWWDQPDKERHVNYATCDFAVEEATKLQAYLDQIGFQDRMWLRLSHAFGIDQQFFLGYLDFFCVNYLAKPDDISDDITSTTTTMDRLQEHRDGSIVSFTLLLSPPDQFEGGGTTFAALRDVPPTPPALYAGGVVRPPRAGDAVLHSGKLLHGADTVTRGQRTLLVGFVETAAFCQKPGVLQRACAQFGRMDVATQRCKHQLSSTDRGKQTKWTIKSTKWYPQAHFLRSIPAFQTVMERADPEYQRRVRLEAEDLLLRSILFQDRAHILRMLNANDISIL